MINKAILTGRLTRDIELRRTNDGTPYTFFTLAVNNRRGQNEQTDFVPCSAWAQVAELMEKYLRKGSLIGVEGKVSVYTKRDDGKFETRVTIQVQDLTFLESKPQYSQSQNESFGSNTNTQNNQELTFANEQTFDQSEVTNFNNNINNNNNNTFDKPEEVNANNINLEEIKF